MRPIFVCTLENFKIGQLRKRCLNALSDIAYIPPNFVLPNEFGLDFFHLLPHIFSVLVVLFKTTEIFKNPNLYYMLTFYFLWFLQRRRSSISYFFNIDHTPSMKVCCFMQGQTNGYYKKVPKIRCTCQFYKDLYVKDKILQTQWG